MNRCSSMADLGGGGRGWGDRPSPFEPIKGLQNKIRCPHGKKGRTKTRNRRGLVRAAQVLLFCRAQPCDIVFFQVGTGVRFVLPKGGYILYMDQNFQVQTLSCIKVKRSVWDRPNPYEMAPIWGGSSIPLMGERSIPPPP